jgi:hypothetical protein
MWVFNFGFFVPRFAQKGILSADVRLDAPVPYLLTGNLEVGCSLVFGSKDGNWVMSARA